MPFFVTILILDTMGSLHKINNGLYLDVFQMHMIIPRTVKLTVVIMVTVMIGVAVFSWPSVMMGSGVI